MDELIKCLKLLILIPGILIILVAALISVLLFFRKRIKGWKVSAVILSVCLVIILIVHSFNLLPYLRDYNNFQTETYDVAVINRFSLSNNIFSLHDMELSLPNGTKIWVKTRQLHEKDAKLKNVVVAKNSGLLVDYCIDG